MRRKVATIAAAAALMTGAGAAVINAAPVLAQEVTTETMNPFQAFIQSLIDDGVVSQAQADTIAERAQEQLGDFGRRGHRGGGMRGAEAAAEVIGITVEELREARTAGSTIADVAEANGVDVQVVIDALVAEHEARIAEAVENGRLTQAEADEKLAGVTEHVEAEVNAEFTGNGNRGPGRRGFGPSDGSGASGSTGNDADTTGGATA